MKANTNKYGLSNYAIYVFPYFTMNMKFPFRKSTNTFKFLKVKYICLELTENQDFIKYLIKRVFTIKYTCDYKRNSGL